MQNFLRFCLALFNSDRSRALALILLMMAASLLEGIGLLILLPILQVIGVDFGNGSLSENAVSSSIAALSEWVAYIPVDDPLLRWLLVFLCLLTGKHALTYISRLQQASFQADYVAQLRSKLYDRLVNAPWEAISQLKSHDIAFHLTTNIGNIAVATLLLLTLSNALALTLAYLVVALIAAPLLVLLLIPLALLLSRPLARLFNYTHQQADRVRKLQIEQESRGQQFVRRHRQINHYQRAAMESINHEAQAREISTATVNVARAQARAALIQQSAAAVLLCIVVWASLRVAQIETGALLLLIIAAARIAPMLLQVQRFSQNIVALLPSFKSHMELNNRLEPAQAGQAADARPIRSLSLPTVHLPGRLSYSDSQFALRHGEIVAVTGASGVGKSTLCDVLCGLLPGLADHGRLNDEPISADDLQHIRQTTAYLEQDSHLWQDSLRDALHWAAPQATEGEMLDMLERVGLGKKVAQHPQGLDAPLGDAGHWLSGGELKRLALAQALLHHTQILILDEFTANLDEDTEDQVVDLIQAHSEDRLILIVTHRSAPLRIANRVFKLTNYGQHQSLEPVASEAQVPSNAGGP